MKHLGKQVLSSLIIAAAIAGVTGCGKKIYLDQPTPKPGEEKVVNENVRATERREPYAVDKPLDELEQDYYLEEIPQ